MALAAVEPVAVPEDLGALAADLLDPAGRFEKLDQTGDKGRAVASVGLDRPLPGFGTDDPVRARERELWLRARLVRGQRATRVVEMEVR